MRTRTIYFALLPFCLLISTTVTIAQNKLDACHDPGLYVLKGTRTATESQPRFDGYYFEDLDNYVDPDKPAKSKSRAHLLRMYHVLRINANQSVNETCLMAKTDKELISKLFISDTHLFGQFEEGSAYKRIKEVSKLRQFGGPQFSIPIRSSDHFNVIFTSDGMMLFGRWQKDRYGWRAYRFIPDIEVSKITANLEQKSVKPGKNNELSKQ